MESYHQSIKHSKNHQKCHSPIPPPKHPVYLHQLSLPAPPPWEQQFFRPHVAGRQIRATRGGDRKKRVIFWPSKLETAKIRCTHHQFGFGETGIAKEKPGRIIYHQPRSLHFISEPIPWIYHSYRLPALFLDPSNKGNSMTLKSPLPNLITFKGHPAELVGKLMAVPNVSAFRMNGINHLTLPGS